MVGQKTAAPVACCYVGAGVDAFDPFSGLHVVSWMRNRSSMQLLKCKRPTILPWGVCILTCTAFAVEGMAATDVYCTVMVKVAVLLQELALV